ncbi:MAG: DegT/DnrJ/EryC1/StrS family aminotransferase [Synergistales bacterium]|nr:DegT/DnrJ/EryC1/StrS family aminotransferase [Synergistales bacterium]
MDTTIPILDLNRSYGEIAEEVRGAVQRVLDGQQFILGQEVADFEEQAANFLGANHATGCASGSDALLLALMSLDLQAGDEVITTPFSFFATAGAIERLGAKPVFCDIDPDSLNLRPDLIARAVGERTRAILPVHIFGQMAPMKEILELGASRNIPVIEDCAQSFGAFELFEGKPCYSGTLGTAGCFSFFPTKNLGGCGDGGLITTNDEGIYQRIRSLRVHGALKTYIHEEVGLNSRLDALQAAILSVKLTRLPQWNEQRREAAGVYSILFGEHGLLDRVQVPVVQDGRNHIFHQYVIQCDRRDALKDYLSRQGIGTKVYYPLCLHRQPCFAHLGYQEGDLPVAEEASRRVLALPIFPGITPEEQERIVETIAAFYGG